MKHNLKIIVQVLMTMGIIAQSGFTNAQAVVTPPPGSTGPNKVYIEQVGSSNLITIEQVGGTNNVGGIAGSVTVDSTGVSTLVATAPSAQNYATINGSTNVVNINQQGSSNSAQYSIKGSNNNYTSAITGHSNQTKLSIGDTNTNGLRNVIGETVIGNSNMLITNMVGSDNTMATTITGNENQITNTVTTSNADITHTINGNSNVINAQQIDAAGANGHSLKNVILGSYNSITTQQQGSNDTTIDTNTNGSHNTITVRTSSSAIATPVSAIAR